MQMYIDKAFVEYGMKYIIKSFNLLQFLGREFP